MMTGTAIMGWFLLVRDLRVDFWSCEDWHLGMVSGNGEGKTTLCNLIDLIFTGVGALATLPSSKITALAFRCGSQANL